MTTTDTSRNHPGGTAALGGRPVARIGYGAMATGERAGGAVDREAAKTRLRRAVELGVNHIDTAEFYGGGAANELIRAALHPYPEDLVLVSKVGAAHDPRSAMGLVAAQRPAELRAGVEANLASLGVERLPVVNLRRMDAAPGLIAEGDQLVALDDQLAELVALRDEGKIGAIGLSNVDAEQLRRAMPAGIACVQNAYSLLNRSDELLLELCERNDLAWVPFFPRGGDFPGSAKVIEHPVVQETAASLGATPAQIGLAWLLARACNVLLIPGTGSLRHLEDNATAGTLTLSAEDITKLNALAGG